MNNENKVCPECSTLLLVDALNNKYCPKCNKKPIIKDMYEEAFFDLKEYKK